MVGVIIRDLLHDSGQESPFTDGIGGSVFYAGGQS